MSTITIEDPREADAAVKTAFPDAMLARASFGTHDGLPQWRVSAMYPDSTGRPDACGYGPTVDEAIAAARKEYDAHDPARALRKQAEKLGFALMPLPV